MDYSANKGFRLLNMYERLHKGEMLFKPDLANEFHVSEKTVQRDIDDLRAYMADVHFSEIETTVQYNKSKNGYSLIRMESEWFTNAEILVLCKILLESRGLNRSEIAQLVSKLLSQATPFDRGNLKEIIRSELHCYVPPRHGRMLLSVIWELSQRIVHSEIIHFSYRRKGGTPKEHDVKPVAILFSEYYFYLVSFMADDSKEYPTIFRIDRLENIKATGKKFVTPYKDRFNDGEFRKRVQFMYSGELKRVLFTYSGESVEAVLDRLPTAEILNEQDGVCTIRAEVYGNGIDMWLRSQGDKVKVLE